jgi:hypothetical protein
MAAHHAELLALLAGELGGAGIVGPLISVFGRDMGLSIDDCRFVSGPLIVHRNGWADIVPKWMAGQAIAERVEIVLGGAPGIVGPTEIAAVMMPASHQAPFAHDLFELYMWATTHAAARHYKKPVAHYWKELGMRPIEDRDVLDRRGRLWHTYQGLASEIRRKVTAMGRSRERTGQTEAPEPPRRELPPLPLLERMGVR